jgi:circadian clock protein KaiB
MYKLKLYVVDHSPVAERARKNLKEVLENAYKGQYSLEIIDLFDNLELGRRDKVFATPTVIRDAPKPVTRVIGDLEDPEMVLFALGLPIPS